MNAPALSGTPGTPSRTLGRRRLLPPPGPGFLGPGHSAVEVFGSADVEANDPFVLLMDDRMDFIEGRKVGGAHPHAGLETVTLVLEGGLRDDDEGLLEPGDLVWVTAGSGVIRGEHVFARGQPTRVLQLWITLPERDRNAPPRVDVLRASDVPVYRAPGIKATLYSGSVHSLVSSTKNYAPITLLDLQLEAGATFELELPNAHNGFLLPLEGDVQVGEETPPLATGEAGWLAERDGNGSAALRLTAGSSGARALLYAGHPQKEPTVHYGPFVAGSDSAIVRQYLDYGAGRFLPVSYLVSGEGQTERKATP